MRSLSACGLSAGCGRGPGGVRDSPRVGPTPGSRRLKLGFRREPASQAPKFARGREHVRPCNGTRRNDMRGSQRLGDGSATARRRLGDGSAGVGGGSAEAAGRRCSAVSPAARQRLGMPGACSRLHNSSSVGLRLGGSSAPPRRLGGSPSSGSPGGGSPVAPWLGRGSAAAARHLLAASSVAPP